MNVVSLIGRLTKDIELIKTPSGKMVGKFNLAVNNPFNKDQPDYIICVVWEKKAELMEKYLGKGSQVGVSGRLNVRSYDDGKGEKRWSTTVIIQDFFLLGSKNESPKSVNEYSKPQTTSNMYDEIGNYPDIEISSDELPF